MATTKYLDNKIRTVNTEPIKEKKQKQPVKLFGYELPYFGVAMIIFSFLGFLAENLARGVTKHIIDCRHQFLPFLFAYGIALLAIHIIMGTPGEMRIFKKRIFAKEGLKYKVLSHMTYFAVLFCFILFGEILVGEFYELSTGVILWDYSNLPLHITKYTSVISGLLYGGGVYLIMAFGFKPMMRLIEKMGRRAAVILDCTLGAAIVLDFIAMIIIVFVTGNAPVYWAIYF